MGRTRRCGRVGEYISSTHGWSSPNAHRLNERSVNPMEVDCESLGDQMLNNEFKDERGYAIGLERVQTPSKS